MSITYRSVCRDPLRALGPQSAGQSRSPCSLILQQKSFRALRPRAWGSLAHPAHLLLGGGGLGEKKPTGRVLGYSAESALLLVVRAIPFAPSLFTTVVATVLERMQFTHSLLSFCTSFSQLSRYGLTNFLGMA